MKHTHKKKQTNFQMASKCLTKMACNGFISNDTQVTQGTEDLTVISPVFSGWSTHTAWALL